MSAVVFEQESDVERQAQVARLVEKAWGCRCTRTPGLCRVDWVFMRGDRIVGFGEFKRRFFGTWQRSTVYFSEDKYKALREAEAQYGAPSVFVVRFDDGVKWIKVESVDSSKRVMAGRKPRVGSTHDQEWIILVPISQMKELRDRE